MEYRKSIERKRVQSTDLTNAPSFSKSGQTNSFLYTGEIQNLKE